MTRPKLLFDPLIDPFMEIRGARHPCVASTGVNFIPNDIVLGKNLKSINKYFILTF
jgi:DNA mismatch repair ATPase MutS